MLASLVLKTSSVLVCVMPSSSVSCTTAGPAPVETTVMVLREKRDACILEMSRGLPVRVLDLVVRLYLSRYECHCELDSGGGIVGRCDIDVCQQLMTSERLHLPDVSQMVGWCVRADAGVMRTFQRPSTHKDTHAQPWRGVHSFERRNTGLGYRQRVTDRNDDLLFMKFLCTTNKKQLLTHQA